MTQILELHKALIGSSKKAEFLNACLQELAYTELHFLPDGVEGNVGDLQQAVLDLAMMPEVKKIAIAESVLGRGQCQIR